MKMLKQILVIVLGCVIALGFMPGAVMAAPQANAPTQLVALAASSRFAAPTDEELEIQKMSERRREELREKRRQWQNRASEAAVEEAEQARAEQEAAKATDEMAEENSVTR